MKVLFTHILSTYVLICTILFDILDSKSLKSKNDKTLRYVYRVHQQYGSKFLPHGRQGDLSWYERTLLKSKLYSSPWKSKSNGGMSANYVIKNDMRYHWKDNHKGVQKAEYDLDTNHHHNDKKQKSIHVYGHHGDFNHHGNNDFYHHDNIRHGNKEIVGILGVDSYVKLRSHFSSLKKKNKGLFSYSVVDCDLCKFGVTLLQTLIHQKKSKDDIAKVVDFACKELHIEHKRICDAVVVEFREEILTVFDRLALSPLEVCGLLFGDTCAKVYNPFASWNVTLPNTPKPPVVPPKPPKPGSPVVRVLQLSDIHVDPLYKPGANADCGEPLCCRKYNGPSESSPAGRWGDYRNCDTPMWTLENLFQHLAQNETFDYIFWTGDLPAHNVWNQSESDQLTQLKMLAQLFTKYFPDKPIFSCLGNHEGAPVNSFPPPFIKGNQSISWLYDYLAQSWTKWLPNSTHENIRHGAYYSVVLSPGLRLVSINTNYCNMFNWWLLLNMTDPAHELTWLIQVLQGAEDANEKVYIIGHIPPGVDDCLKAWSWNYYKIINRYESTIVAQFFGHTHRDNYEIFYDDVNFKRPVSMAYIAGSVTPYSYLNPNYRVYTLDGHYPGSSRVVLNHENYILNLTEANLSDKPVWRKEYSAKDVYGLPDLSAKEWNNLIYRMQKNATLFSQFHSFYYKSNPPSAPCDHKCMLGYLCELKSGRSHDPRLCSDLQHDAEILKERLDREKFC